MGPMNVKGKILQLRSEVITPSDAARAMPKPVALGYISSWYKRNVKVNIDLHKSQAHQSPDGKLGCHR